MNAELKLVPYPTQPEPPQPPATALPVPAPRFNVTVRETVVLKIGKHSGLPMYWRHHYNADGFCFRTVLLMGDALSAYLESIQPSEMVA